MRISDWSSDVCSSDLSVHPEGVKFVVIAAVICAALAFFGWETHAWPIDRKSVVSGKSVSVRVDLGGRRIIKKIHYEYQHLAQLEEKDCTMNGHRSTNFRDYDTYIKRLSVRTDV